MRKRAALVRRQCSPLTPPAAAAGCPQQTVARRSAGRSSPATLGGFSLTTEAATPFNMRSKTEHYSQPDAIARSFSQLGDAARKPAQSRTQIAIRARNCPNAVANILQLLASQKVRVVASHSCEHRGDVGILLVVENGERAKRVLDQERYEYHAMPILLMTSTNETVRLHLDLLDAGIEVLYSYRCVSTEGKPFLAVRTTNDAQALRVLNATAEKTMSKQDRMIDRQRLRMRR